MKRIEIFGENDSGKRTDSRTGCRAVILKNGKILLSCESKTGIRTLLALEELMRKDSQ